MASGERQEWMARIAAGALMALRWQEWKTWKMVKMVTYRINNCSIIIFLYECVSYMSYLSFCHQSI